MCISIYIGTQSPLELNREPQIGELAIEKAIWTPPPLQKHNYIYYAGEKSASENLACSCLLLEHIEWTQNGPLVSQDDNYPTNGKCPFESLREVAQQALDKNGFLTIVCDDSGGLKQKAEMNDYDEQIIRLSIIQKNNLLFSHISGGIPWKAIYVISDVA